MLLRIRSVHLVSDFSAKQRFDSAYKHSRSTLDKFKEFVFQSVQEILGFAFVLPEKRLNRDTKLIFDFEAAILHYIDGVVRKYILRIGFHRFATPVNTEYNYFLPTSRQYNAELPSQNRNWFIK